MLHAALLFALAVEVQSNCHSEFVKNSWELLTTARYGQTNFEQAAFAVLDADGRVRFVRWPFNHSLLEAKFDGPIPANTFAIVHTHPNGHPMPSFDDGKTAQRLGIPVYALTINAITRTTGKRSEFVVIGEWNPERCAER